MTTILKGNIVSAPSLGRLDVTENGYLIAENGVITGVYPVLPEQYAGAAVEDCGDALIVQSFADLHLHAPQYPMLGMGMDLPLLDWLNAYAFPTEARFADPDYARTVYRQLAQELAAHGTTRVCMFSSLHTDATLIRAMEEHGVPIRMISPGRVYRKDAVDATHSPMFHQIEGLVVDKGVTMADLKGTLNAVIKAIYGPGSVTRFRPHHFPFTEPSCEVDIQCHKCGGKGCPTCKGEGWIEVLGAGMVHPKVLRNCGIDPDEYSGFAFGMGLERFAMGHFKISDLRLIFENDERFLTQF